MRTHKTVDHKIKETNENVIIGFRNDVSDHLEISKAMEDDHQKIKCEKCVIKTHNKGLLMIHVYSMH